MSTTTFVSGLTRAIPAHPGVIPASGSPEAVFADWNAALTAHESAKVSAEKGRKFSGRATDETIRRWATDAGLVGEVTVRVITHTGHIKWGAYCESRRTVTL